MNKELLDRFRVIAGSPNLFNLRQLDYSGNYYPFNGLEYSGMTQTEDILKEISVQGRYGLREDNVWDSMPDRIRTMICNAVPMVPYLSVNVYKRAPSFSVEFWSISIKYFDNNDCGFETLGKSWIKEDGSCAMHWSCDIKGVTVSSKLGVES